MKPFLNSQTNNKLEILSLISTSGKTMTVNEIRKITGFSSQNIRKLFLEMKDEGIFTYDPNSVINISWDDKAIKSISIQNLSIDHLATKYLHDSVLYQMIYSIFINGNINRAQFCSENFISQPTFSRNRMALKKILKDMRLDLNNKNEIIGEELRIRTFFFYFFSNGSAKWMFDTYILSETDQFFSNKKCSTWKSNSILWKKKITLLLYISRIRTSQSKNINFNIYLSELPTLPNYDLLHFCSKYLSKYLNTSSLNIDQETIFIIFMLIKEFLWFDSDFITQLSLTTQKNTSVKILTTIFTKNIENLNGILKNELLSMYLYFFHYNMKFGFIDSRHFLYYYNPANFFYKDNSEKRLYSQIQLLYSQLKDDEYYSNFLVKYNIPCDIFTEFIYLMVYNIKSLSPSINPYTVSLYVQNKKSSVENILKFKLKTLYQKNIKFVPDLTMESPDFIITDEPIFDKSSLDLSHSRIIYVTSFSDKSDLDNLYSAVGDKILDIFYNRSI